MQGWWINFFTMPDFEIVGLKSSTNGRSCCLHTCCGEDIAIGDVLRLVPCAVSIEGVIEDAVKCVKVVAGVDECTVVYVPRVVADLPAVKKHFNKFVTVIELYDHSTNKYKRDKSYKNCGMASVTTLDDEHRAE